MSATSNREKAAMETLDTLASLNYLRIFWKPGQSFNPVVQPSEINICRIFDF